MEDIVCVDSSAIVLAVLFEYEQEMIECDCSEIRGWEATNGLSLGPPNRGDKMGAQCTARDSLCRFTGLSNPQIK